MTELPKAEPKYVVLARPVGVGPVNTWPTYEERQPQKSLADTLPPGLRRDAWTVRFRWAVVTATGWSAVLSEVDGVLGHEVCDRIDTFLESFDEEPWEFEFRLVLYPAPPAPTD